jgi:hypothetical protein
MINVALKAFSAVAVFGSAMVLGPIGGIGGLMIAGEAGSFAKAISMCVGGGIGLGISAALSQIKLKDKTLMEYIL